jgi:ABC-2 type transport system ATP-binding protein
MQEVKAICQRVIIIDRGRIVANESVEDIHNVVRKEAEYYEVEFDKPVSETAIRELKGVLNLKNTSGNSWTIEAEKGHDIRADIFRLAVNLNLAVLTLKKSETSLEDIFRQVTRK